MGSRTKVQELEIRAPSTQEARVSAAKEIAVYPKLKRVSDRELVLVEKSGFRLLMAALYAAFVFVSIILISGAAMGYEYELDESYQLFWVVMDIVLGYIVFLMLTGKTRILLNTPPGFLTIRRRAWFTTKSFHIRAEDACRVRITTSAQAAGSTYGNIAGASSWLIYSVLVPTGEGNSLTIYAGDDPEVADYLVKRIREIELSLSSEVGGVYGSQPSFGGTPLARSGSEMSSVSGQPGVPLGRTAPPAVEVVTDGPVVLPRPPSSAYGQPSVSYTAVESAPLAPYARMPSQVQLASVRSRYIASWIDGLITSVGLGVVAILFYLASPPPENIYNSAYESAELANWVLGMFLVLAACQIAYHVNFLARNNGQTPGKMVMKIRVVKRTGEPLSVWDALLRSTLGYWISAAVLGIGFLWAIFDANKQTWHDKLVGTYVVKV